MLESVGGLDEDLDTHGGWYLDLELGLRLIQSGVRFVPAEDAITINLAHPRGAASSVGTASGLAYFYAKHPRMDVIMTPLYFQRQFRIAEYERLMKSAARWWPSDPTT
jgi:hypothetical protein